MNEGDLAMVLLLQIGGVTEAGVYKWVDKSGRVHYGYSHPPESNARSVAVPEVPSHREVERARQHLQEKKESVKMKYMFSYYLLVIVSLVLTAGCDTAQVKLLNASLDGNTERVKSLLAEGADVNSTNYMGATALIGASQNGHTDIVKILIAKGADVNAKVDEGQTALMYASMKGHTDIVRFLIAAGADVNATSHVTNLTALSIAENNGHKKIVDLLEQAGEKE